MARFDVVGVLDLVGCYQLRDVMPNCLAMWSRESPFWTTYVPGTVGAGDEGGAVDGGVVDGDNVVAGETVGRVELDWVFFAPPPEQPDKSRMPATANPPVLTPGLELTLTSPRSLCRGRGS